MKKSIIFQLLSIVKFPLLFVIVCWLFFVADNLFKLQLYQYGVSPRTQNGLIGILLAPLIHGDLNHIANNSLPILILASLLFYFYKPIAWPVFIWIYFISGLWLWIGGRNNDVIPHYHFGASTLIYAFSTFLFFSGVFRKHIQLMVVSALVVLLYGSITYGIFPFQNSISWEGHLFGALSGVLVAYGYRKDGPQKKEFNWLKPEDEVDLEALYMQELETEKLMHQQEEKEEQNQASQQIVITYNYVTK